MKELLRKGFWQSLKKTFDEALEGPPDASSGAEASSSPERSADLDTRSTSK